MADVIMDDPRLASSGPGDLQYFVKQDPVTNIGYFKQQQLLSVGGQVNQLSKFVATSSSTSTINFVCNPPSRRIITDRVAYIRIPWTITFTGTGNPLLQLGTNDGLRQFPSLSVLNSITCNINGVSVTTQPYLWIHELMGWYQNNKLEPLSQSPSMPDMMQSYNDYSTLGSVLNPLSVYGDNSSYMPRSTSASAGSQALGYFTAVSNGNGTATVSFEDIFPIPISPWLFSGEAAGFTQVDTINLTLTFSNNLGRMWSHASGGNSITNYAVALNGNPEIYLRFVTPEPDAPCNKDIIDRPIYYDYNRMTVYPKAAGVAAQGAQFSVTTDSLQLGSIPHRLYVYAKRKITDLTDANAPNDPDCWARLDNLVVRWNNNVFLSQASSSQLYLMSVRNGLKMKYPQWKSFTGSIACIEFGKDIGLNWDEFVGKKGSFNLQIQAQCTDLRLASQSGDRNYDLYVVVVESGMMGLQGSGSALYTGYDLPESVTKLAERIELVEDHELHNYPQQVGGSFFGKIGNFFKKAAQKVLPIARAVGQFIPGVDQALDVAENVYHAAKGDISRGVDQARDIYREQMARARAAADAQRGRGLHVAPLLGGFGIGGFRVAGRMKKRKGKRGGCMDCSDDTDAVGRMSVGQLRNRLAGLV